MSAAQGRTCSIVSSNTRSQLELFENVITCTATAGTPPDVQKPTSNTFFKVYGRSPSTAPCTWQATTSTISGTFLVPTSKTKHRNCRHVFHQSGIGNPNWSQDPSEETLLKRSAIDVIVRQAHPQSAPLHHSNKSRLTVNGPAPTNKQTRSHTHTRTQINTSKNEKRRTHKSTTPRNHEKTFVEMRSRGNANRSPKAKKDGQRKTWQTSYGYLAARRELSWQRKVATCCRRKQWITCAASSWNRLERRTTPTHNRRPRGLCGSTCDRHKLQFQKISNATAVQVPDRVAQL